MVKQVVTTINGFLWDYALLFLLIGTGVFFTLKLRFIQIRKFGRGIKMLFGNSSSREQGEAKGLSTFQALTTAIAAQVGTGNVAGAATAIVSGGPGAIFWMWVSAFFGMATIYGEAVMAQHTKEEKDGSFVGGPSYYIKYIFRGKFGKFLATFFSVAIIIACGFTGCMVQSNSISSAFETAFHVDAFLVGAVIAVISGVIFIGGIKRIGRVTEKVVPIMAIFYIVGCLIILIMHPSSVAAAFKSIFVGAFTPKAIGGGVLGVTVQKAMRFGIARGLFSNEAGMGTTPHAHATAEVNHPSEQGIIAMMGVFIDTFIVLTVTALVILSTNVLGIKNSAGEFITGTELAQSAFDAGFGNLGKAFLAICLLFFAFTTIIGWYFFGEVNVRSLFGNKMVIVYSVIVVGFIILGSVANVDMVWNIQDMFNGLMVLPNLIALLACAGVIAKITKDYEKFKK